jgi:hypothetical protein
MAKQRDPWGDPELEHALRHVSEKVERERESGEFTRQRFLRDYNLDLASLFHTEIAFKHVKSARQRLIDSRQLHRAIGLLDRIEREIEKFRREPAPGGGVIGQAEAARVIVWRGGGPQPVDPRHAVAFALAEIERVLADQRFTLRFHQVRRAGAVLEIEAGGAETFLEVENLRPAKSRKADLPLERACWRMGEKLRAISGRPNWKDVAKALEYLGHPPMTANQCRLAARQFKGILARSGRKSPQKQD